MDAINENIEAFLDQIVEEERDADHEGCINKDTFGICAVDTSGLVKHAANAEAVFHIESASKPLALALALEDCGAEEVFRHVGKEPNGDAYHSVAALEEGHKGFASNPMITAGAIAVTGKIHGVDGEERFSRLRDFVRSLASNPKIDYDPEMLKGESLDLHRALFYYMRDHDVVKGREEDTVLPYARQTALTMNCIDLGRIASVLANKGRVPGSDRQLIKEENVRIVLTVMFLTGMYEASGRYAVDVGIPSKSGVSGAIMAVVPGRMGFGVMGPKLDAAGNSIAGVRMLGKVARRWNLSVFS
ncbi:glutaminase A [Marinimicrobium alkaliphilum]|uniref:glutaminase A n=1 Tax=Marinimicrobium alkaliphilum TaxID=2202654 RepID=UPI000DB99C63|nr:glutaminase A [Marinimicrobium alkaliphilum]